MVKTSSPHILIRSGGLSGSCRRPWAERARGNHAHHSLSIIFAAAPTLWVWCCKAQLGQIVKSRQKFNTKISWNWRIILVYEVLSIVTNRNTVYLSFWWRLLAKKVVKSHQVNILRRILGYFEPLHCARHCCRATSHLTHCTTLGMPSSIDVKVVAATRGTSILWEVRQV